MTDDVSGIRPTVVPLPKDDLESRSITWPTVLGGFCLVYAVLGIFSNTCGTASMFLGDVSLQMAGIEVEGGLGFPKWIEISSIISGVMGLILAGLLTVGGIGLIRRRPASLGLLKIWVVAAIVTAIIRIVLGFFTIDNNIDLQMRIQDATAEMVREQSPQISGQELADMGLNKSADEIRAESTRNTLLLGGVPMIFPIILGFLLTSKGRVQQVDQWE